MTRQRWRFYRTAGGAEVVRGELEALGDLARAASVRAMKRRERGESFPRDDEAVGERLRALRVTAEGNEYQLLYAEIAPHREVLLALVALGKKSRKLPKPAIDLAARRLSDWEKRGSGRR